MASPFNAGPFAAAASPPPSPAAPRPEWELNVLLNEARSRVASLEAELEARKRLDQQQHQGQGPNTAAAVATTHAPSTGDATFAAAPQEDGTRGVPDEEIEMDDASPLPREQVQASTSGSEDDGGENDNKENFMSVDEEEATGFKFVFGSSENDDGKRQAQDGAGFQFVFSSPETGPGKQSSRDKRTTTTGESNGADDLGRALSQLAGERRKIAEEEKVDLASRFEELRVRAPKSTNANKLLRTASGQKERGNAAFSKGLYKQAVQCYKDCIRDCRKVQSVPSQRYATAIKIQVDALSNRAAAYLMLGNAVAASHDCEEALKLMPSHERAQIRWATCKLKLCSFEEAKALLLACKDKKFRSTLHKEVLEKIAQTDEILQLLRSQGEASMSERSMLEGLRMADKHLEYIPDSRALIATKCRLMLGLRRYADAHNFLFHYKAANKQRFLPPSAHEDASLLWLSAKAQFGLGRIDEAIDEACKYVRALEAAGVAGASGKADALDGSFHEGSENPEEEAACRETVGKWRRMLELKNAANEAFNRNDIERSRGAYTEAIQIAMGSCEVIPLPFMAILFSNRSATFQKEGQIVAALSDCAKACTLDMNYAKAYTRAAAVCQEASACSLGICWLEDFASHAGSGGGNGGRQGPNARAIQTKLKALKSDLRYKPEPNYYKILGLDMNASLQDIKKAYHKLALKFHPDKDPFFTKVAADSRTHMNHIFDVIRSAYEVLSSETRRGQFDAALMNQVRSEFAKPRSHAKRAYGRHGEGAGAAGGRRRNNNGNGGGGGGGVRRGARHNNWRRNPYDYFNTANSGESDEDFDFAWG